MFRYISGTRPGRDNAAKLRYWFRAERYSKRFIALFSAIGLTLAGSVTYALAAGVSGNGTGGWTTCTTDAHADVANQMIVRNNGHQQMCLSSPDYGDHFTVTQSSVNEDWAGFPNIYTGCEYDGADANQLCTSGHGTPIRLSSISKDQSSISYHMPSSEFTGNSTYDLWFNRSGGTPHGRDNGAEVMIWLGSDGLGAPYGTRKVEIDGMWFAYDSWSTAHSGGDWNYIRYWRLSGYNDADTSVNLNLLPFFRDAESAGSLSSSWYLTGSEYGFEVCDGGAGLKVNNFTDTIEGPRRYLGGLQHKGK